MRWVQATARSAPWHGSPKLYEYSYETNEYRRSIGFHSFPDSADSYLQDITEIINNILVLQCDISEDTKVSNYQPLNKEIVMLLRRPNNAWVVTTSETDPGTPLVDGTGQRVVGVWNDKTKQKVMEALTILRRQGGLQNVKGFLYHTSKVVIAFKGDEAILV